MVHKRKLQFAFESFATEFSPLHRSQTGQTLDKIPAKDSDQRLALCTCLLFSRYAPAGWFQKPHYCSLVSGFILTNFTDKTPHFPPNDHHNGSNAKQPLIISQCFFFSCSPLTEYVIMNSDPAKAESRVSAIPRKGNLL